MSGYAPDGFFVLRAPRLALAPLDDLRARVDEPEVRDALATAAPGLAAAARETGRSRRVDASLTRYLARMSGRPTPRGLLAGVSVGRLGGPARLRLGEARPVSSLSVSAAIAIAARLEAAPELRDRVPYRPNPSLHAGEPGRLHYVESRPGRPHAMVAVTASPELSQTLERARTGATLPELAAALAAEGIEPAEAETFVAEMAAAQLLISSLAIPATGPDPGRHLLERVRELAPASPDVRDLEALVDGLAAADAAAPGERAAALERVRAPRERLGAPLEIAHVDIVRDAPGLTLPDSVASTLLEALDALRRIDRGTEPEDLTRFRTAFRERYGERPVPLLEALDPDTGIGFGAEAASHPPPAGGLPWGPPEQLMLRLVTEAAAAGLREVDLTSALPSLAERPAAPLPDSFAVMATLAADSEDAVSAGDYEVRLTGAFGPSGVRLFGRFCHHHPGLRREAERHLRAEEALRPDALFAEIAHLPSPRVGDVVSRPALRAHEIALLAGDGREAQRIDLAALTVALEDDELVLRDGNGRRVIPRLTNAHQVFGEGLGLYRFLALLQFQGLAPGLSWSWGPLEGAAFLPRVRLGRTVLALARWRISPAELRGLRQGDHEDRVHAVRAWRERAGCPRFVGLPVHESALPLDLDDPLCAETLLREAPPDGHTVVDEWWPAPERSPVTGPGGRYAHELLIPFLATHEPVRDPVRPPRPQRLRRVLPPGSEWLYAKLYTAAPNADALIADELAPFARAAVRAGAATGWHFLRYADPEFHVRVRLQGGPETLQTDVLPALLQAAERLIDGRRVRRVVLDTYDREVERYGGDAGILLAERAFSADSEAVAKLLAGLPRGEDGSRDRWQVAAAGVWSLFAALGLTPDESVRLGASLRDGLASEHRLDRAGVGQLARRLRTARPAIEALLDDPPAALRERDAQLAPVAAELERLERSGALYRSRAEIAGHLAHMHCNRLLRASPRPQELRIHDALVRIAAGRASRGRQRAEVR